MFIEIEVNSKLKSSENDLIYFLFKFRKKGFRSCIYLKRILSSLTWTAVLVNRCQFVSFVYKVYNKSFLSFCYITWVFSYILYILYLFLYIKSGRFGCVKIGEINVIVLLVILLSYWELNWCRTLLFYYKKMVMGNFFLYLLSKEKKI